MGWVLIVVLAAIGAFDLYLVIKKKDTISQRYHKMLPQWADYVVLVVVAGGVWWFWGELVFSIFMFGVIAGHLMWHEGG
jgi:hypothetical protein